MVNPTPGNGTSEAVQVAAETFLANAPASLQENTFCKPHFAFACARQGYDLSTAKEIPVHRIGTADTRVLAQSDLVQNFLDYKTTAILIDGPCVIKDWKTKELTLVPHLLLTASEALQTAQCVLIRASGLGILPEGTLHSEEPAIIKGALPLKPERANLRLNSSHEFMDFFELKIPGNITRSSEPGFTVIIGHGQSASKELPPIFALEKSNSPRHAGQALAVCMGAKVFPAAELSRSIQDTLKTNSISTEGFVFARNPNLGFSFAYNQTRDEALIMLDRPGLDRLPIFLNQEGQSTRYLKAPENLGADYSRQIILAHSFKGESRVQFCLQDTRFAIDTDNSSAKGTTFASLELRARLSESHGAFVQRAGGETGPLEIPAGSYGRELLKAYGFEAHDISPVTALLSINKPQYHQPGIVPTTDLDIAGADRLNHAFEGQIKGLTIRLHTQAQSGQSGRSYSIEAEFPEAQNLFEIVRNLSCRNNSTGIFIDGSLQPLDNEQSFKARRIGLQTSSLEDVKQFIIATRVHAEDTRKNSVAA